MAGKGKFYSKVVPLFCQRALIKQGILKILGMKVVQTSDYLVSTHISQDTKLLKDLPAIEK